MKVFHLAAFVLASPALASPAGPPQSGTDVYQGTEIKHISTTLPDGGAAIHLSALNIERNWSTSITRLKENVRVYTRAGGHYLVIHADESSYNPKTGELIPSGHVRVTQEARVMPE